MSYLNYHFPFFWFRSLRWCGSRIASNRRRSLLEVQTAGDTDQELQGDSQNQVRRRVKPQWGELFKFFVKWWLLIEKESCGLAAGSKMVVAIGLDESLLTNKTKQKRPGPAWMDGAGGSPFICRRSWMRLIRLIQADWNPKMSVWVEAERTKLTCRVHCHVDILFWLCSTVEDWFNNTVNNLLRFFC